MKKIVGKILSGIVFLAAASAVFCFSASSARAQSYFYEDSGAPLILPRSSWDNSPALNKLMTWIPEALISATSTSDWQPVERIVVHYTATPNNDPLPAIERIQSIYRYHAALNGWGDIGYNYLIDQKGNIYEGRFGGNGVRAAHAYNSKLKNNYNYGSIGISLLGTYDKSDITPQMYDSLERLIGWLGALNGLDVAQTNKTGLIWNSETLSFSSQLSGPVVLGHHDLDATKTDPGAINLKKVREAAAQYKTKFENYVYRSANSAKVYKISNGSRKTFSSLNELSAAGQSYSLLVSLSDSQLGLFSETRFLKFPDGSLLRIKNQNNIYLIEDGKKRVFQTSAAEFSKLGFSFTNVREVEAGELDKYPTGLVIKFASPQNRLLSEGQKVYQLKDGKKRWVASLSLFNYLGLKWPNVKKIQESENYLEGAPLSYPDGTLLRVEGDADVYLIKGGVIGYVDGATFKKKKYSWSKVLIVSAADFEAIYGIKKSSLVPSSSGGQVLKQISPTPVPSPTPTPIPSSGQAFPTPTPSPASQSSLKKLRVALGEVSSNIFEFTSNVDFDVLNKTGQIIISKKANEKFSYQIPAQRTEVFVKIISKVSGGILTATSFEDHPAWKPSLNYNEFRGSLEIVYSPKTAKVWLVNELDLEDYVKGVAEMLDDDPEEHLKAMILASRTYAYSYLLKNGKYGAEEVFHLKNTTADQLYKGYGREKLASKIAAAAEDTRGEIIFFNNEPITAAYSSGASEIQKTGTKNACTVWGQKFCESAYSYLNGGAKDPVTAPYNYSSCSSANHCVGLSAAGAREMARQGKTYQEILKNYYLGVEVKKIY